MKKLDRLVQLAAEDEARKHGATVLWLNKNKHSRMQVIKNGKIRIFGFSCTPHSGDNAIHWVRQDVRRIVGSM